MTVIFLDLDGVLLTWPGLEWSGECIAAFNWLRAMNGTEVVVCSAWRHAWEIGALREEFVRQGIEGGILDYTPLLYKSLNDKDSGCGLVVQQPRWKEIEAWLAEHQVERWVWIDDSDMGPLEGNGVRTECERGLTMEEAAKASAILLPPSISNQQS
jgi:hypothetical protein